MAASSDQQYFDFLELHDAPEPEPPSRRRPWLVAAATALLLAAASVGYTADVWGDVKHLWHRTTGKPLPAVAMAADATVTVSATVTKTVDGWPEPIVVKGNKLFGQNSGLEFRVKGMAYYPRPNAGKLANVGNYDWFTDDHEAVWRPHLAVMQDLGVNTIRLYSVDPGKPHDKFMCACAEAGMYVIVGMAAPCENCSLTDELPPTCYPDELFERMQIVYNAFAVYDNTLGFSVGNENNLLRTYEKTGIQTMPCAKALLRDTRAYAASCAWAMRQVPIGLDLADTLPRAQWLEYMDCIVDENEFTRAEWLGFNPYVECNPAKNKQYSQSPGLQNLMDVYKSVGYPHPLMFGEFGCNLGANTIDGYENQRGFYDAKWMNEEPEMTEQIVGGNVFEFVTEIPNTVAKKLTKTADNGRYGVGFFSPDNCDHDAIPCEFKPYPEYANLKSAYTTTTPSTLKMADYKVTRTKALTCPISISTTLRETPAVVTPLACSMAQPKCNGAVSNNGNKTTTTKTPSTTTKTPGTTPTTTSAPTGSTTTVPGAISPSGSTPTNGKNAVNAAGSNSIAAAAVALCILVATWIFA